MQGEWVCSLDLSEGSLGPLASLLLQFTNDLLNGIFSEDMIDFGHIKPFNLDASDVVDLDEVVFLEIVERAFLPHEEVVVDVAAWILRKAVEGIGGIVEIGGSKGLLINSEFKVDVAGRLGK